MDELATIREFASERTTEDDRRRAREALLGEVARAARRPRVPRGRVVLAVALALVVVTGAAVAIGRYVVVGDPAPPSVQESARRMQEVRGSILAPRNAGPKPVVETLRAGVTLASSVGPVYLWVAEATDGGLCTYLDLGRDPLPDGRANLSGGCGGLSPRGLQVQLSGSTTDEGDWVVLLNGAVDPARVERLTLEREGETADVPLTGRFVLAELDGVERGVLPHVTLRGYGADGALVATQEIDPPSPPAAAPDVTAQAPLIEIRTRRTGKPVRLYVSRSGAGWCKTVSGPGGTSHGCDPRPVPEDAIHVNPEQIGALPGGMLLLHGNVGAAIAELRVRFADGRSERLRLVDGWTLYQVAHADYAPERQPRELIGLDDRGNVVARRTVLP